jgi:FAD/FMN-containing dehydrogenase
MSSVSISDGIATVPAGCGPSVGIAGLTLGGRRGATRQVVRLAERAWHDLRGLGILGRKYGLTCDHLLAAQVVLAGGRVLKCDEHHDAELFWALRGAGGGNFGVVMSLAFNTLRTPAATIFHLTWPYTRAAAVVEAWQAWTLDAPDELHAGLRLGAPGDASPPTFNAPLLGYQSASALLTPGQEETVAMARSTPSWQALQGAIAGEVVLPGSPAYQELPKPFNARFHHVEPQAIVRCATPQDVAETISFTGRHSLEFTTRSGGHCFAGRSTSRGLVIDVTPMASVSVSGDLATVGAGARLGAVYDALQQHDLAIPAGTCPPVGVAGLTLGGGLGILGRSYGVTSDHLLATQLVLADGRMLDCDQHHEQELFWALRGGGAGNFGVVTSLVFGTVPASAVSNFHLVWPPAHAAAIIEAWQGWAPLAPDELAASLKLTAAAQVDQPASVDVYGALLGTESDATRLLDGLVVRADADPSWAWTKQLPFAETRRFWAELPVGEASGGQAAHGPSAPPPFLVAKSEFFRRPLPAEAVAALVEGFLQGRAAGESRELDFMPWGGAYNRVPAEATAFVHRDALFQLKHAAVVDPQASTDQKEAAHRWVTRSWASVHRWGSGRVFQNFADPELEDWQHAYYGPNFQRLVRVKARYDPDNVFHFHQSLPAG